VVLIGLIKTVPTATNRKSYRAYRISVIGI